MDWLGMRSVIDQDMNALNIIGSGVLVGVFGVFVFCFVIDVGIVVVVGVVGIVGMQTEVGLRWLG